MKFHLVARRDLAAYLNGYYGFVIIAVLLLVEGVVFNAYVLGSGAQYSHNVLSTFFELTTWTTGFAGWLLSMRAVAEERQIRTELVLQTSPISDTQIIVGKYLAVMGMIALFIALTVHMPIMIMIYGKVSASHIIVGYIGLFCYGSAAAAIGIFGSSLVRSQVFAVILSGGLIAFLALIFRLSEITEPPFSSLLEYAALYNKHMPPFHKGLLGLDHLIYYVSVTWLFLVFSVRALDRRRWQ